MVEYDTGLVNETHALAPIAMQTKEIHGLEVMRLLSEVGLMFNRYNLASVFQFPDQKD